jgi:hypothetical protein
MPLLHRLQHRARPVEDSDDLARQPVLVPLVRSLLGGGEDPDDSLACALTLVERERVRDGLCAFFYVLDSAEGRDGGDGVAEEGEGGGLSPL